jgi:Do/DeqQ family serine protease
LITLTAFHLYNSNIENQNLKTNKKLSALNQVEVHPVSVSPLTEGSVNFRMAADKTVHSVVHIFTEFKSKSSVYDKYFSLEDFFYGPRERTYKGSGSGVIISSDGYIVTNNHVVQQADKITVTLNDKREYEAKLIGNDPSTDLALIKIDQENLNFLTFGNSDKVMLGDWVLAVGNPFNLSSTVTAGIVSAKARNINILGDDAAIESFIQTDAAVNRGNSGGALVDVNGSLIGINAAIASPTGSFSGYSFAIPSNIANKVVNDLKEYGRVQRAYLGVAIRDIDNALADKIGLDKIQGVYVDNATENSAAAREGIKKGDVVIAFNGKNINSVSELLEQTGQHSPGDEVELLVLRDNKVKTFNIELTNVNGTTALLQEISPIIKRLGASYKELDEETKKNLKLKNGVIVSDIKNGLIKNSGMKEGFIIIKVDGKEVKSVEDINNILKNKTGGVLFEGVYPNGINAYYGLGL